MKKKNYSPEDVLYKIKQFAKKKNIQVFLVGGYLRDKILKKKNKDIDIVMENDALAFSKEFASEYRFQPPVFYGKFGTSMIEIGGVKVEFATARKESYPEESRKPYVDKATIEEDCSRRDFTINTIMENLITGEIVDIFEGKQDLKNKIVRTPINPNKTFYDDPLRILRGIRFATKLRFDIEEETIEGMKKNVSRLKIVSQERITDEVLKTIDSYVPSKGFYLMEEIGILNLILPEVSELKKQVAENCKELFPHTLKVMDNTSRRTRNVYLKFAALLHDIGKPKTFKEENGKVSFHRHEFVGERMAYKICKRMKISDEHTQFICFLIRHHLRPHLLAKENPTDSALRRFIREIGKNFKPLFVLAKSDITSGNPARVEEAIAGLDFIQKRMEEINKKDKLTSFKLAIDGYKVMEIMDFREGREVGLVKNYLEEIVLDGALGNRKRELTKYLKENRDIILESIIGKK
ncbi:CCA tRNA nucleotidyltransferase [bacterium]|nr:CCA tRNA nucleotidyltransferase [bacterium]